MSPLGFWRSVQICRNAGFFGNLGSVSFTEISFCVIMLRHICKTDMVYWCSKFIAKLTNTVNINFKQIHLQ